MINGIQNNAANVKHSIYLNGTTTQINAKRECVYKNEKKNIEKNWVETIYLVSSRKTGSTEYVCDFRFTRGIPEISA